MVYSCCYWCCFLDIDIVWAPEPGGPGAGQHDECRQVLKYDQGQAMSLVTHSPEGVQNTSTDDNPTRQKTVNAIKETEAKARWFFPKESWPPRGIPLWLGFEDAMGLQCMERGCSTGGRLEQKFGAALAGPVWGALLDLWSRGVKRRGGRYNRGLGGQVKIHNSEEQRRRTVN